MTYFVFRFTGFYTRKTIGKKFKSDITSFTPLYRHGQLGQTQNMHPPRNSEIPSFVANFHRSLVKTGKTRQVVQTKNFLFSVQSLVGVRWLYKQSENIAEIVYNKIPAFIIFCWVLFLNSSLFFWKFATKQSARIFVCLSWFASQVTPDACCISPR